MDDFEAELQIKLVASFETILSKLQELDTTWHMGSLGSKVRGFRESLLGTTPPSLAETSPSKDL